MAVSVDVHEGVASVMVDNPPVNALDDETLIGLCDAASGIATRADVRAVVLTGAGEKAFIAGADLHVLREALGPEGIEGAMSHHVSLTGPAFGAWRALRQPLVAAVGANALGGGLEFALCCDVIVADPRARFGLPEVTLGLMPGAGGTQRLPRLIGVQAARELVLLGLVIDATRAHELGLVGVLAGEGKALEEALSVARRLAALPAVALQSAKRALRATIEQDLDDGLALERGLFLDVARSADARAGVEAFLEKRKPEFAHS